MTTRVPHACSWAGVALTGLVISLLLLVVTPVLRPDLNVFEKSLSYYAIGPWGILQSIAFAALGIASASLGVALLAARLSTVWLQPIVLLLIISGIAGVALVWYPVDAPGPATLLGDIHQTAGTTGGVAQLGAALAFALAVRTDPVWRDLFLPAITLFLFALAGAILSQASIWWPGLGIPMGATMRLLVVPLSALWGVVALRLRRRCR